MPEVLDEETFDEFFGLCSPNELVVIRPFNGDEDDRVLEELRPKYVVLYDADTSFIRRVEVGFVLFGNSKADLCCIGISSTASGSQSTNVLLGLLQLGRRTEVSPKHSAGERIFRKAD